MHFNCFAHPTNQREKLSKRLGGSIDYRTWKRRTCEAIPTVGLVGEPKESCTGTRRTKTCVAPSHVDASRGALLKINSLCCSDLVCTVCFFSSPYQQQRGGGGDAGCGTGSALPHFLFLFYFPC